MFISRHLFLIAILALASAGVACTAGTEEVKVPKKFKADFYVRYLVEANELKGQAFFFDADSAAVKIAKGVAFMGSGTKERSLPGDVIRYEATMNTPYPDDLRFNFTLPDSPNHKEVKYQMSSILDFEVLEASKESGLVLDLDGTLQAGETLLLLFTDPNQEARTVLRPGPLSREQLLIPADALAHFVPGAYRLYIVKQTEFKKETQALVYNFSVEYYTKEIAFNLKE